MDDLISKSALVDRLSDAAVNAKAIDESSCANASTYYAGIKCGFWNAAIIADNFPTVDAVPVVRCAECISFDTEGDGFGICQLHEMTRREEHFCSDGKRSEDD